MIINSLLDTDYKICSKCGKRKNSSKFGKDSSNRKDGLRCWCKECLKEYDKEFHKKYPWKRIFENINSRCNNPKSINYKWYGEKGIENHLTEEDVKFLYIKYKGNLMIKPSIDRKNNDKNYTLENCKIIEMKINNVKDRYKPIFQYSLNGTFIKEWKSILEAGTKLKIDQSSIIKCCKGDKKYNHAGGFKWKYKLEK